MSDNTGVKVSQRVPKYRVHKGSGQAVVTLNGRDHYLGVHGTRESRAEYNRIVGEWLANDRQLPALAAAESLTVAALILRHHEHLKRRYEPRVQNTFRSALRPVRRLYGHTPAVSFGPLALKSVREELVKNGLGRATINSYVKRIRALFRWAAEHELLPAEVWARLRTVEGLRFGQSEAAEPEPVTPVADAIVEKTLPHLSPVVADMARVQRLTGMRPGEVCAMTPAQIETTGKVWLYRPATHKNTHRGQDRVVALGPRAQAILAPYLRRELNKPLFCPRDAEALRGHETSFRDGYDSQTYRQAVKNACVKAEVPTWKPNQLRHTAATQWRKEFGLDATSALLGHRLVTTSQIYAERSLDAATKVAAAVG